jgi:type II secretion system protein G
MLSQVQYGRCGSAKVVILTALVILVAGLVWVFSHLFTSVGMFGGPRGPYRVEHLRIQEDVSIIKLSLNRYKSINGRYPTTERGLAALVAQRVEPDFMYGGRTILQSVPRDPWGSDYIYLCPGNVHADTYDLYSAGPDHIPNTSDDDWGE